MDSIVDELRTWESRAGAPAVPLPEAFAYCRRLATTHYENFTVASRLLPPPLRQHFCNVYAYCRWADDLGDEIGDPRRSLELLAWWRDQMDRCYAGEVHHPVFVALRETISAFDIPRQPFADLISAFEQDQTVTHYETFDQLRDYCRRSADPVGRIVLLLSGASRDETIGWSDSICTGLQLANFWQDVARDFDKGRVYLPQEDREQFGYRDDMLERRETNAHFLKLMEFQVRRAREFLMAGTPLIDTLPGRMRVVIDLFRRGGLATLAEIERIDFRVWDRRPALGKAHLSRIFLAASARGLLSSLRP